MLCSSTRLHLPPLCASYFATFSLFATLGQVLKMRQAKLPAAPPVEQERGCSALLSCCWCLPDHGLWLALLIFMAMRGVALATFLPRIIVAIPSPQREDPRAMLGEAATEDGKRHA